MDEKIKIRDSFETRIFIFFDLKFFLSLQYSICIVKSLINEILKIIYCCLSSSKSKCLYLNWIIKLMNESFRKIFRAPDSAQKMRAFVMEL